VDIATERAVKVGVWSGGQFFVLGRAEEAP